MPSRLGRSAIVSSALSLASILDLRSQIAQAESVERTLNVVLLSVMGKLKISRACAFRVIHGRPVALFPKGLVPPSIASINFTEPTLAQVDDPITSVFALAGIRWCLPLLVDTTVLGMLCFGPSLDDIDSDDDVRSYLDLVCAITSTALHNDMMVQSLVSAATSLERQNLLIRTLFETTTNLSSLKTSESIIRSVGYTLMAQLMISNYAIVLNAERTGVRVLSSHSNLNDLGIIADALLSVDAPCSVGDLPKGVNRDLLEQRSIAIVAPLQVQGLFRGSIVCFPKLNGEPFSQEDLTFVQAVGNTAMVALENVRLFQEEVEKRLMDKELGIAAEIQRNLLPISLPNTPGYDVAALSKANRHVSGDYYDVIPISGDRTLLAIADVAGKGMPAAILMANVQAALNVLATLDIPIDLLVHRINNLVCDNTEPEVFVTLFVAIVDPVRESIHYVNAGHNWPVLLSSNNVVLLKDGGPLAGVIPNVPDYAVGTGTFHRGDMLALYTDGITEARDANSSEYGLNRLVAALQHNQDRCASDVVHTVLHDIEQFVAGHGMDDDFSLVITKPL